MSYNINTVTGTISNVFYNGVNDSSSFASATTSLTSANTILTGFYGSTGTSNSFTGYVDNFAVTGVPEPSTWVGGLATVGLLGLALRHRFRA